MRWNIVRNCKFDVFHSVRVRFRRRCLRVHFVLTHSHIHAHTHKYRCRTHTPQSKQWRKISFFFHYTTMCRTMYHSHTIWMPIKLMKKTTHKQVFKILHLYLFYLNEKILLIKFQVFCICEKKTKDELKWIQTKNSNETRKKIREK